MNPESKLPYVKKSIRNNPAVMGVATAATGFVRQIVIKPYIPASRRRELALRSGLPSVHAVHCSIFREKGSGTMTTIVLAGFVPDATEVVEFQRPLFKNYGDIYYVNYPRNGFSMEMFAAQLADLIEVINKKGERPVLFGISFGCGLLAAFLKLNSALELQLRGVVLASPVLCKEDLVRPKEERTGGVRMLESNLNRILNADPGKPDEINRQVERARRCFQALFEAGAENRTLNSRHLSIRGKIMDVLRKTTFMGGYERVLALKQFGIPDETESLFSGPALVVLAEAEENVLVAKSPSLKILRDACSFSRLLPQGSLHHVTSCREEDLVAHASLIFHNQYYNPLLDSWYERLASTRLKAVL
jgi:hypothetical protein